MKIYCIISYYKIKNDTISSFYKQHRELYHRIKGSHVIIMPFDMIIIT